MLTEIRRYWRWTRGRDYGSFDDQGREQVGLSPVLSLAAEREKRAARAKFRHATRHGRAA